MIHSCIFCSSLHFHWSTSSLNAALLSALWGPELPFRSLNKLRLLSVGAGWSESCTRMILAVESSIHQASIVHLNVPTSTPSLRRCSSISTATTGSSSSFNSSSLSFRAKPKNRPLPRSLPWRPRKIDPSRVCRRTLR